MFRLRPKMYKRWLHPDHGGDFAVSENPPAARKARKRRAHCLEQQNVTENSVHEDVSRRGDFNVVGQATPNGALEVHNNTPAAGSQRDNFNPDFNDNPRRNFEDLEEANNIDPTIQDHIHGPVDSAEVDSSDCVSDTEEGESEHNVHIEHPDCYDDRNLPGAADANEGQEENIFCDLKKFLHKHDLDKPLTAFLPVSRFEVFLMILVIVMRHGITGPLIEDLLKFVNTIVGVEILPTSKHIFYSLFSVNSNLQFHFICDNCALYLGEHKSFDSTNVSCTNCGKLCNVNPSSLQHETFFVSLSIRYQLQSLIKRAGNLIKTRSETFNGTISDITDGRLYRSLCEEGKPLSNPYSLSLTLNTDGGEVFKHSAENNSMWPCQVICNELEPSQRYKPENMMLAALWFGKRSPNMTAFLKPLSEELKELATDGIKRELADGSIVNCPVHAILCVCDSVAKPKVQNIAQFNGYYGCGYCMHPGVYIDECAQVRFPLTEKHYRYRTEESVRNAMIIATEMESTEVGVKGLSALLLFSTIHLVFGMPIDYMHGILIGVMKRLVGLWFDESSHAQRYYLKQFEAEIDRRLRNIRPPSQQISRPKKVSKRGQWKAKDYGAFLLFYGLPALEGILPKVYWEKFRDLCSAIFILLKDCITEDDLEMADFLLQRFVKEYNQLNGDKNMVYNIHLVTHLVTMVKLNGTLSMYSAFSFESGNGCLVKLVSGTNSVASQICRKFLASKSIPYLFSVYNINQAVSKFCEGVLTIPKTQNARLCGNVMLLGYEVLHFPHAAERTLLQYSGLYVGEYISTYNRAIFNGNIFTSTSYTRPKRTDDTCFKLRDGRYGVIDKIFVMRESECWAIVRFIRVCPGFEMAPHLLVCAGDLYESPSIIRFEDITLKCLLISSSLRTVVGEFPNSFERD